MSEHTVNGAHGPRPNPNHPGFETIDPVSDGDEEHKPGPNGGGEQPSGTARASSLSIIWADDIVLDLATPGLVDGLLKSTALTVLYGESGVGKTFVALDLACQIATGRPWRGMAVEQGVVVYIAAEGPESVKRRLWAWKRHHGVDHLPVVVVQSTVDLLSGDTEKLADLLRDIRKQRGRVALVVVDTLARAMTGNENTPDDMGRFVGACAVLREASAGHVLVVHHCGKDTAKGARGHSSLRAATDTELEITGEGGGTIRVTKCRDDAGGAVYGFKLAPVNLGVNSKDRMVQTCVAEETDAPASRDRERRKNLGANEKIVFDALAAAINDKKDKGEDAPLARDIPRKARGVQVVTWRKSAFRYLPQPEAKRKAEAFERALKTLVAGKYVRHVDGFVWLP